MDIEKHKFIIYGYKDIFGEYKNGLKDVIQTIKEYNIFALISAICKISLILHSNGRFKQTTQSHLVHLVFKNNTAVINQIDMTIQRNGILEWGIFSEQQLLLLLKITLLNCRIEGGIEVDDKEVEKIGYCLLKVTDICLESKLSASINLPWSFVTREYREYIFRQYFLNPTESWIHRIIRYNRIIQSIKKVHYEFDVDTKFKIATDGISIDTYSEIGMLLLSKWIRFSMNGANIGTEWRYSKKVLFSETALDQAELNKLFNLLFLPMSEFAKKYQEQVKKVLKGQDIFPFNFLLFQQFPLIPDKDKDLFTCPSPEYLCKKLTEVMYWVLKNYFEENGLKEEHEKWLTVWGDAYEDYIDERLNNAFGSSFINNIEFGSGKKVDGLINGSKYIFVIETKYRHLIMREKLTGNEEDMSRTMNQLFSSRKNAKGIGQLMDYIKDIHEGKRHFPFERKNRKIIPVLVVGESMPVEPFARRLYEDKAKEAGAFIESDKVLPFIILNTEEVETLEAIAVKLGMEKAESLLYQYAKLFNNKNFYGFVLKATDFHTYLTNTNLHIPRNESMFVYMKEIMNRVRTKAFNKQDLPARK